jgi:hypothetical protein
MLGDIDCELGELDPRVRERIFSAFGGAIFALAYWIFIDAILSIQHYKDTLQPFAALYLPGIGCTVMFGIVNLMDWSALGADDLSHFDSERTKLGARAILVFAILLGLSSLVGALVLLSDVYAQKKGINDKKPDSIYPGAAVLLQTMLLFMSSFITRLGRRNAEE